MKKYVNLLVCCFFILTECFANELINGKYAIKNYENLFLFLNSYSIWCSAQSKDGIMYFGAEENLLEYDGVRWKVIPTSKDTPIRSICLDSNGILYVGSSNDLGYVDTQNDSLCFVSLRSHVPEKFKHFEDVWNTYIIRDKVYYVTQNHIMEWDGRKFKLYPTLNTYHKTTLIDSTLWFIQQGIGVSMLKNGRIQTLKNSEFFKDKISEGIVTYQKDSDKILIGTREHGIFLSTYNETSLLTTVPLNHSLNKRLEKAKLYGIQPLSPEYFMLSTLKEGIFVINLKGEVEKQITTLNGLNSNTIYSLLCSPDDILWITTSRGVSKMLLNSPLMHWDVDFGIDGGILAITRYQNTLKIGTLVGLFDYQPQAPNRYETFVQNTEQITAVWTFYNFRKDQYHEDLLLGATEGLFKFDGKNYEQIAPYKYVNTICHSIRTPGLFYIGDNDGVGLIKYREGVYENRGRMAQIRGKVNSIEEVDEQSILVALKHQGLYLIQFEKSASGQPIRVTKIESSFVSDENLNVFKYHEKFIVTSSHGIFLYNPISQQIERNNYMGKEISEYKQDINSFSIDTKGNIWVGGNVLFFRRPDDTYDIFNLSFPQISTFAKASRFFHEPDGKTWIGGEEGLFLFNTQNLNLKQQKGFTTLIRSVSSQDHQQTVRKYQVNRKITLPAGRQVIRFEYCAPFFVDETSIEYAYYLEGQDRQWSFWSNTPFREYTNLATGEYVFKVKSKNIFNEESSVAQVAFTIEPHWYKSRLFSGALAALLLVIVFLISLKVDISLRRKKTLPPPGVQVDKGSEIVEHTEELPVAKEDPFLCKTRKVIENQLHDPNYSIHDLAKAMAMSHTNLYRKIKTLTGLSISAYINQIRLEKAAELLRKEDVNVAAVSYAVGFSDPAYFTRCFKKHFGVPPSNYLKNKAKN